MTKTTKKDKRSRKAFEAPRNSTFLLDPEEIVIIGHDTEDGPGHPLYAADCNDPLDEVFVENVFQNGVDTDVTITKWEGRACAVVGRTRVRAARVANIRRKKEGLPLIKVGCKVVSGTELKLARRKIRENNVRKTLGVLQKAEDAQYLLDQGMPIAEVAVEFMVKPETIKEWTAVLGATADVRKAVSAGKIGATAAAKIAKLEGGEAQREALQKVLASGKGSVVEAKRAVRQAKAESEGKKGDGMGVVSRKHQRALLDVASDRAKVDIDDSDFCHGFAEALRVILGEATQDTRSEMLVLQVSKAEDEKRAA